MNSVRRTLYKKHMVVASIILAFIFSATPATPLDPIFIVPHIPPLLFVSIENIEDFLDVCPANDPMYSQIRSDFTIRRNGVTVGNIPCAEPVSALPLAQYTEELITLQGLRVIYYMDYGQSGHLPWTSGSLYQWMKSKIGGINISDSAANSYCCETSYGDGRTYIVVKSQDDFNRDFDRSWRGIAGNIGLYVHETRHVDGYGHVACNGQSGQDQSYNQNDLTPFGIQWWLEKSWLMGDIYVGYSCLGSTEINEIAGWHLASANTVFSSRFCGNKPPQLTMPQLPGGQCAPSLPANQYSYAYTAPSSPVKSRYASDSKPLAVGSLATGGNTVTVRAGFAKRSDPVDIYMALYVPALDPNVYIVKPDNTVHPASKGIVAWKKNVTGIIDETPFGTLATSQFPKTTYFLGILVAPAGDTSLSKYYLWATSFAIH